MSLTLTLTLPSHTTPHHPTPPHPTPPQNDISPPAHNPLDDDLQLLVALCLIRLQRVAEAAELLKTVLVRSPLNDKVSGVEWGGAEWGGVCVLRVVSSLRSPRSTFFFSPLTNPPPTLSLTQ